MLKIIPDEGEGGKEMAILIGDTETTGLKPGYIAQLSCIRLDGGKATGFNAWFKVKSIEDGAAKANGLSIPLLDELSGGKEFYDRLDDIIALYDGVTDFYGYNTRFDRTFIETEFKRCSLPPPNLAFQDVMLTAKAQMGVKKNFKLVHALEHFGLTDKVEPFARQLFGACESLHDARYDATATFLLARKLNML